MTLSNTCLWSEPFSQSYYFGPERQSRRYESQKVDPSRSYEAVAKVILQQSTSKNVDLVFIKDMAYYVKGRLKLLQDFFPCAKHSFLIRDPEKSIPSLYRMSENPEIRSSGWDYFEPKEAGFKELHETYEFIKENLDPNPVIVNADDLLESPKQIMKAYCDGVGILYEDHMTSWKADEVLFAWHDGWAQAWRQGAVNSSGFLKPSMSKTADASSEPEVTYPNAVIKAIEESRPFYDKLCTAKIRSVSPCD